MEFLSILLKVAGVLALVFLNGFFVAAEFAMVKVRATQLEPDAADPRKIRAARHLLEHLDTYLSASQLGITMASLGLGWVGEPFVADLIAPVLHAVGITQEALIHTIAFTVAFSVITFLHIVLGEQAPKWYAIQHARGAVISIARPLQLFTKMFRPFIWFVNASANTFLRWAGIQQGGGGEAGHTDEELRLLLKTGGALSTLGRTISLRAMELRDRSVREVMVPRTSVVFLSTRRSIEENIAAALDNQFTRYPLCEGSLDQVVGMIHLKDLFRLKGERGPGSKLLEIRREMLFVPETTQLEKMLNTFLARRLLMAIAVDEYGGTAGLVTLENVLEELVGDILDEFDVEPAQIQRISETEYLVDGRMPLHEFGRVFGIVPDSRDVVTVSGYVIQQLDRVPARGEVVRFGEWDGTVEATGGRTVNTLRMRRAPPAEEEEEEHE
jgi:CBS domain containing-hemolysin-like protein